MASFDAALAAGDVDAMRRLLQERSGGKAPKIPELPPTTHPAAAKALLYRKTPTFRFPVRDDLAVTLVQTRVMGKVVWPAGHSLACQVLEEGERQPRAAFVEVGAGSGLPSLVAARACANSYHPIMATDFTEAGEQLLRANAAHNGVAMHVERLELSEEHGALAEMVERVVLASCGDSAGVCVCAAEICYDKQVIDALFAAVALMWRRRAAAHPNNRLLFARSSHFEHMDETMLQLAGCHELRLHARARRCTPGVLDCFASNGYTGCDDDDVEVFTFTPGDTAR